MVLTIVTDSILIRDIFFVVSILLSSKVESFHNEPDTFLHQKVRHYCFLTLSIGILYKSSIFS